MRKLIKHILTAAAGILLLVGLGAKAQPVAATTDHVDIVLHKLLFETPLPDSSSDGSSMDAALTTGKPLNGVTFTAYDVTDAFWQIVNQDAKHDVEAAQRRLAADDYVVKSPSRTLRAVTTANGGVAKFERLSKREHGRYAVYLFKETEQPAGITQSQNLVVVLPGNLDDATPGQIDLYPKNQMVSGHTTIEKTIQNHRTNFAYGETIPYQIKVKVPANIGALTKFKLQDSADQRLERIGAPVVTIDGQSAAGMYQLDATGNTFSLTFDAAMLVSHANQTLKVTYQMRIKPGTTPDVPLINRTVIYPGDDNPATDMAVVVTGGKRFEKVDAKAHGTKLSGAEFVVRNAAGKYLVQGQKGWEWRTISGDVVAHYAKAGLFTATSDQQGRFALAGLAAGAYSLVEVKAPIGYQRSMKAIGFMVVAGEFTRGQASPYTVVNVKLPPNTPGQPGTPGSPRKPNAPRILTHLPKTGSEWAAWLSVLGGILIALVWAIRVKTKKA